MALPEIVPIRAKPRHPDLFARLPHDLFKPLASPNHERYWMLLTALHRKRFGPDAPLPPAEGLPAREIIADIEQLLEDSDPWVDDEDDSTTATVATSINARANMILIRLVDTGWLERGRHGAERVISMSPQVGHFLDQLVSFADSGPVYVGAKIHSIEGLIDLVQEEEAGGDVLMEAALQTRNLLQYVRNTGTVVRDMMVSLRNTTKASEFVRQFFDDYIEKVFLGDFRALRTQGDHPLSKRYAIIRRVDAIDESPIDRERLINWYEQNQFQGNRPRAEVQYERDLFRLRELSRLDEYLDRLDNELRRANRQATVYLDYTIRTVRPIDQLVRNAVKVLERETEHLVPDPFPPGSLASQGALALSRTRAPRPQAAPLRVVQPTPRELAVARLSQRAMHARMVYGPKMTEYLLSQVGDSSVSNDTLVTGTVPQGRAYQELSRIAFHLRAGDLAVKQAARSQTPGFIVTPMGDTEEEHPFISGAIFGVARRMPRKTS